MSGANFVCFSGRIIVAEKEGLPFDTRAFRSGFGLVETLLLRGGAIPLAPLHWERLFSGLKQLGIPVPKHFTPEFLEEAVLRTVRKNGLEALCRVRLQVWPGSGGMPEALPATPDFLIECFALEEPVTQWNENGLVAGIAEGLQKSKDDLANLKSCNALIYAAAAQQAKARRWNDALIRNTSGNLIESSIANIFWIKDDVAFTPPLSEGCVAGVMRRRLIAQLPGWGISLEEAVLTDSALKSAEEVFLTNAIRGVKWIGRIGDQTFGKSGSSYICARLQAALAMGKNEARYHF